MSLSSAISAKALISFLLWTAPVGFAGELIIIAFVFGLILSITDSGLIVSSSFRGTPATFPPIIFTRALYDTNPGFAIITSSPGLTREAIASSRASDAPEVTIISEGSTSKEFSSLNFLLNCSRSSTMPGPAVYAVNPPLIASIAACLIC